MSDSISIRKWAAVFILWMSLLAVSFVTVMAADAPRLDWSSWGGFQQSVTGASPLIKLIILCFYLSLACTFIPLNTGWIISAAAIYPGINGSVAVTVLAVASAGALSTTIANLNDYHVFALMLRSRRIASIRQRRFYATAEKWFARSPIGILMFFNVLPIPVDVSRPLAASHRYPRHLFAAANFCGRFIRYAIIAALTFMLGELGWIATIALVAVAAIMILIRLVTALVRRITKEEK